MQLYHVLFDAVIPPVAPEIFFVRVFVRVSLVVTLDFLLQLAHQSFKRWPFVTEFFRCKSWLSQAAFFAPTLKGELFAPELVGAGQPPIHDVPVPDLYAQGPGPVGEST